MGTREGRSSIRTAGRGRSTRRRASTLPRLCRRARTLWDLPRRTRSPPKSLCQSQFPYQSVNLFVILVIVKDNLTVGELTSANDSIEHLCVRCGLLLLALRASTLPRHGRRARTLWDCSRYTRSLPDELWAFVVCLESNEVWALVVSLESLG